MCPCSTAIGKTDSESAVHSLPTSARTTAKSLRFSNLRSLPHIRYVSVRTINQTATPHAPGLAFYISLTYNTRCFHFLCRELRVRGSLVLRQLLNANARSPVESRETLCLSRAKGSTNCFQYFDSRVQSYRGDTCKLDRRLNYFALPGVNHPSPLSNTD